ncbi:MAG TPA: hypothetical protein VE439_00515 [Anaerolineae bacterium]|nr:hypothetical protein [Anaerolineae bacterium]
MTYGERMGRGHMGHRHRMGGPMGGMAGMPMGMMGGPMGMMPMGMCPWCAGMGYAGGKRHWRKGPLGIAKIAKKELLTERVKAKLEAKYGDDLDKMADEIVNFAEESLRMKADYMKRAMEMRRRMWEFLTEEPVEEGEEEMEEGEGIEE